MNDVKMRFSKTGAMPTNQAAKVIPMTRGKSLTVEQNEAVRAALLKLVAAEGGKQAVVARKLKLAGPTVSNFLAGKNGAGMAMAEAVARLSCMPLSDLLGLTRPTPTPPSVVVYERMGERWGDHNMWEEVAEEAMRRYRRIVTPELIAQLEPIRGSAIPRILTPEWIMFQAQAFLSALDEEEAEAEKLAEKPAEK
jgi:hypothetical protein